MDSSSALSIVVKAQDQASATLKQVQAEAAKTGSAVSAANNSSVASTSNFRSSLKDLLGNFKDASASANQEFGAIAGSIGGLVKVGAAAFIGGAIGLGTFISQASELQSIKASFVSMTGSVTDADKVLQSLYQFSFKTAFSQADINAAARAFLGAGLSVDKLGTTLQAVGDVAGATGANLGQLTLPLSQALARGTLQTQDYYQILNSGAGKLGQVLTKEVADRGLGNIQDAMSKGKVTSDILFDAIQKASASGGFAFQGAANQALTFAGQLSNLQESAGNVGLAMLGVNKATGDIDPNGVFAKLSKAVQDATTWLTANAAEIQKVGLFLLNNAVPAIAALGAAFAAAKIGQFITSLVTLGARILVVTGAVSSATAAQWGFNTAAAANPIGLIILAIVALVAGLVFLQVKFNIFGKAWEGIKIAWGAAVSFFTGIWNGIVAGVSALVTSITGFFGGIWNGIKTVFNNFVNFIKTWGLTILAVMFLPFSIVVGLIIMFWQPITAFFGTIWAGIVAIFTPVVSFFSTIFQGVVVVIQTIWNFIIAYYVTVFNIIMAIFTPIVDFFGSVFTNAWNVIKSVFGAVGGFFAGVWNTIVGLFTGIGTAVGNAIGGTFKSVINGVLSGAIGIINGFIGAIDTVVDVINKIPGVKIGKLTKLSVPQLATGGIVMPRPGGVLTNLAEKGKPEVVLPLSKISSLLNNSSTGSSVQVPGSGSSGGGATSAAITNNSAQAPSSGPQVIVQLTVQGNVIGSNSSLRELSVTMAKMVQDALKSQGTDDINLLRTV